jgi:tetratricopeptide (TPR) repeat protein
MPELTVQQAIDAALEHHRAGRLNQAEQLYRQILAVQPDNAWALQLLGMIAHQVGNSKLAIQLIERAIAIDPTPADFHNNLGEIYRVNGRLEDAEASLLKCLAINPNFPPALNNLGEVYRERGELERASDCYRKAIEIEPQGAAPYNNLGIATHDLGDPVAAIDLYKKAISLGTNYVDAVNNLATSYLDLRRVEEAKTTFRQALSMDSQNVDAHNNLGYALLMNGEFAEGWEEYEWRWKCAKFPSPRRGFRQPLWNGEDIAGKRILVHSEQGLGDAIHFLRYVPMVSQRSAHVILECKREMTSILKDFPGVAELVTFGDPLPPFDWQVPMLSLPRAFKTRLDSIPADVPYLHARPDDVEKWREKLGPRDGRPRVGIAWAGNPTQAIDRFRSMQLSKLAPFAKAEQIEFHSVQKGYATEQLKSPPPGLKIIDHSEELTDFAQTAALMMNLDLIVSTCTSVPHLAGALGRPVWIMVPRNGDWRWMVHGETTPWYPTMRLFRQEHYGNWDSTIARVADELVNFKA